MRGVHPSLDEVARAGDFVVLAYENAVHVGEPALDVSRITHGSSLAGLFHLRGWAAHSRSRIVGDQW